MTPRPFSRGWPIHASCTWVRMPSLPFAFRPMRRPPQERPSPFEAQTPETVEDRLPRWKVGWQVAPRTTRSQDVKNGIKNGTQGVDWRPTTLGLRGQKALQILPLPIKKIAGITGTHPSSLSCEVISAINKTRSKTSSIRLLHIPMEILPVSCCDFAPNVQTSSATMTIRIPRAATATWISIPITASNKPAAVTTGQTLGEVCVE